MSRYVIAMYIRLSVEDTQTESLSIPNRRLLLGRHIDILEQDDVEINVLRQLLPRNIDRIGRNIFETARWMEWIRKNGVRLYTADDPYTEIFFDNLGYYIIGRRLDLKMSKDSQIDNKSVRVKKANGQTTVTDEEAKNKNRTAKKQSVKHNDV